MRFGSSSIIRVRPLRGPEEHGPLAALWQASVEATHHFLTPADVARYRPRVEHEYLPALAVTVAVGEGDLPLGFLGRDGHRVEMLFVAPEARGGGAGTALLSDAQRGRDALEVDVNEQNPDALAFYVRRGFVETGRSPLDADGRPFPLVHLRRTATQAR